MVTDLVLVHRQLSFRVKWRQALCVIICFETFISIGLEWQKVDLLLFGSYFINYNGTVPISKVVLRI